MSSSSDSQSISAKVGPSLLLEDLDVVSLVKLAIELISILPSCTMPPTIWKEHGDTNNNKPAWGVCLTMIKGLNDLGGGKNSMCHLSTTTYQNLLIPNFQFKLLRCFPSEIKALKICLKVKATI